MKQNPRARFYEVLTAAVADMTEHGFDSQERLDGWLALLNDAARSALVPQEVLTRTLSSALGMAFRRATKPGAVMKLHPGVSAFKLEMIKPALRAELDRRILASASLIKINREASIARTLQRFSGWATSIPAGGSDVTKREEVKKTVRKGIAALPFEERRVIIDQGAKLTAAISDIIATDGGAIAARWHHVAEGPPAYASRPQHVARNGKVYLIRGSWAHKGGLVKPGKPGYTDEITQPGEEVFCSCLPGDTFIPLANINAVYRRWYVGPMLQITTATGKTLRLTPNHPVLSDGGWCAAENLNVGDDLVERVGKVVEAVCKADKNKGVPTISQVFDLALPAGLVQVCPGASEQFHGDGGVNSDVDIVTSFGTLRINGNASAFESSSKLWLSFSNFARSALSAFFQHRGRFWSAFLDAAHNIASSFFRGCGFIGETQRGRLGCCTQDLAVFLQPENDRSRSNLIFPADLGGGTAFTIRGDDLGHRKINMLAEGQSSFGFIPDCNANLAQTAFKRGRGNLEALRELLGANPGEIGFSKITRIDRESFSGHVFNLRTVQGWYVANGIITHNCSYTYIYNLRDLPSAMLTLKGKADLAEAQAKIRGMK